MSEAKSSDSSGVYITPKLTREIVVQRFSTVTPAPSEGINHKTFDCPLCVEVFKQFCSLRSHLLSMHPRRKIIMRLVKERYGITKRNATQSPTLDSKHVQAEPCTCCTTEKSQPVVMENGTVKETSKIPHKLRHKAAARPKMNFGQCETCCKKLVHSSTSMRHEIVPTLVSTAEERSSWESYLSFCVSESVSSEPVQGSH